MRTLRIPPRFRECVLGRRRPRGSPLPCGHTVRRRAMKKRLYAAVSVALVVVVSIGFVATGTHAKKKKIPTQYIAVLNTPQQVPLNVGDPVPGGSGLGL